MKNYQAAGVLHKEIDLNSYLAKINLDLKGKGL